MIKNKSQLPKKLSIDLTGPEGNAFVLIGYAKKLCHHLEKDPDAIMKEMTSGDYDNLIAVFEREFGSLVILYR